MSIEDDIALSRKRVDRNWPVVADHCPDRRLAHSSLQPVEGMNGNRALDLDRRYHIDSHAVAGGMWAPLSTRFQDRRFAEHSTITLRRTEVVHLRGMAADPGRLGATVHVQMYGDDDGVELVVIAELAPIIRYLAEVEINYHHWLRAYDGTPFIALTCGQLSALEALVWRHWPNRPEQMGLFA
jgi:hypothetical protein